MGPADRLDVQLTVVGPVIAPIAAGQTLGSVTLSVDGKTLRTVPLTALQPLAKGSLFTQLVDTVRLWLDI